MVPAPLLRLYWNTRSCCTHEYVDTIHKKPGMEGKRSKCGQGANCVPNCAGDAELWVVCSQQAQLRTVWSFNICGAAEDTIG